MKEGSWNGASTSKGPPWWEPGRSAPLQGVLNDMLSEALEWASVSIGAPLWGNIKGRSFLRAFEINRYIKRDVKMPCKMVSLSIGALLGNLEGIRLPGLLREKNSTSGFLSWTQRTLRF
jgi:hypothetical protein